MIDGGRPAEIRPLTPRLRNLLHPKPEVEEGIVVIGAHILRLVDPALAAFKAHASCGGTGGTYFYYNFSSNNKLMITIFCS